MEGDTRRRLDRLTKTVTLVYPRFSSEVHLVDMTLRCDPSPSWKWNPSTSTPFYQDTRNAIFVVAFWIISNAFEVCLLHFITRDHLLSMTTPEPDFLANKVWAEWAVSGTRLVLPRRVVSDIWVCNSYGTKYTSIDDANNMVRLQILDFNQSMLRKSAGGPDDMIQTSLSQQKSLHTLRRWWRRHSRFDAKSSTFKTLWEAVLCAAKITLSWLMYVLRLHPMYVRLDFAHSFLRKGKNGSTSLCSDVLWLNIFLNQYIYIAAGASKYCQVAQMFSVTFSCDIPQRDQANQIKIEQKRCVRIYIKLAFIPSP
jgi:hypothetical protein